VHALGPISKKIDDLVDMKGVVDGLAEQIRAGMREGSVMTTYEDDEKVVWRQFRRELIGEGYRSRDIHRMKGPLKEYLRKLANGGLLDEASPENVSETTEITHEQRSLQDPESFPSSSGSKDKVSIPAEWPVKNVYHKTMTDPNIPAMLTAFH
jgi:hypothetical protein